MEEIKSCEGIVVFANQCSAIILKGSWDEEGFYPEGLTNVHFNSNMYGNNRLFPGDVLNVKVDVKKSDDKESIEWLEEMADFYEESYDRADTKREMLRWLKEGVAFKEKYEEDLKRDCFGTFEYTSEFREFGKTKKYSCCGLGACFCQEECFHKHMKSKKVKK